MTHRAFLLPLTEKHTQCYLICNQNEKTQADDDDFCGFFMIFQELRKPLHGDESRTLKAEADTGHLPADSGGTQMISPAARRFSFTSLI